MPGKFRCYILLTNKLQVILGHNMQIPCHHHVLVCMIMMIGTIYVDKAQKCPCAQKVNYKTACIPGTYMDEK